MEVIDPEIYLNDIKRVMIQNRERFNIEIYELHSSYKAKSIISLLGITWTEIIKIIQDDLEENINSLEEKSSFKFRSCLKCNKSFISKGAHNRLCRVCQEFNQLNQSREFSLKNMYGRLSNRRIQTYED